MLLSSNNSLIAWLVWLAVRLNFHLLRLAMNKLVRDNLFLLLGGGAVCNDGVTVKDTDITLLRIRRYLSVTSCAISATSRVA